MLRLRAFRPTSDKVVKIQLHPTHPWLVTADANDRVSVWDWEHRQVIYELKAGGVDERRLVGVKLEKLAEGETDSKGKPTEAIRGGSVKQVSFYDDDVRFWQHWRNCSAASEAPTAVNQQSSAFSAPAPSTRGRHFVVICCENKAIFLDLVTMRGRDVPKQELDNKSLLCMEFLSRSSSSDAPLVAFGASDGVIRVLSMMTWKLVRRYTGGHKGAISCLMTFMSAAGEVHLVSGGSDGLLVLWSADHIHDSRELVPKISLKAHDGGVVAVELSRVMGSAPQLITIGADKTLAIWDTVTFKEIRRIKPVPKLACHSVASWCHPRAPNLDILTCVKDSHIWAIEHPTYSALTRPLCELSSLVPPQALAQHKKLRVYCMVAHPLQPHLVATGTNIGIILSEFDPRALPAVAPLPALTESKEHSAVYIVERELKLLNFQLSNTANPSLGSASETGRSRNETIDQLIVKQSKKHISTPAPHDSYSILSASSSGKYVAVVWPDIPSFVVYKASDWSVVDSGTGKLFAWDSCRDRYALVESALAPRMPLIVKGGSSKKAKEAAAAAAQAAAAAASAASTATVQVRILLDDGTAHVLQRSIDGRSEPVVGLHGGALLGVTYRTSRRISPLTATAISTVQSMPLSGFGGSGSSFASDDPFSSREGPPQNFQLYSWETYQPVSGLLAQPEWTVWDQTVEYCAFAYQQYIVISSLRPQFRYLGDVSIPSATGAVWHRRQLFVATPTTIECVFVDAGVAAIDIETKKRKEEMKAREAQGRAVADHGDLALITVEGPQVTASEKISLRPSMLQVVRLASFQHAPSIPPFIVPKQSKLNGDDSVFLKELDDRRYSEVAVAGGGVSVAVTRFPSEQKRPIGPLVLVGVRDGVLWLVDRYMCAHALSLSHPGIRCRCLAAYGDPVSAVKWATRLGREHHDDLAQFMLGMGYATEALHLPGISKRLEFDLAMQSKDLKRALACLLTMSNSRDVEPKAAHSHSATLSLHPSSYVDKARMNNTLPVTAPTAHAPTPSPAPAPKLGAGNMASRWRELHGSDSWKGLLDPLDVDLRRSIIAYGELASAAHDGFNLEKRSPHAGLCLYSRDRLLSASTVTHPEYYKVTKFLYATCGGSTVSRLATSVPTVTSALFVQPLGKAEETPTSNWMGYVAVATEEGVAALGRRDIVVVWRGTENDLEWEQDKHCRQVSAAPVLGRYAHDEYRNAEVHRGFLSVYTSSDNNSMYNKTSAREQVLEEVGRLMKEYKDEVTSITVTGHSLGASLATLTAIDMVANDVNVPPASNQPPCPVTAILLASPRVGNDAFKSAFGSFDHLRALHVANAKDIVPMNPPSVLLLMQYVDSATETIVIDTDRSPYVVHKMLTHHVLELYLHGVAGDHGDKADFQLVVPRDLALVNKTTDLLNDEHQVPACWWVIHRKCMAKGTDGQWKLDDFEEA